MNNFCTCGTDGGDYDFDKGDHDHWWECDAKRVPPVGAKCCECDAPLPTDRKRDAAVHYEVYEPDEPEPEAPPSMDFYFARKDYSEEDIAKFDAMQEALEAFRSKHGWDDECERYEREVGADFRCDRCEGEVEILAQLDVCVSSPGELPGLHEDHYWQAHRRRIRWRPDADGVFQPMPWRLTDYARHYRRKIYWRIHSEWSWKFKYRLKRAFVWPVKRKIASLRRYWIRLAAAAE